MDTAPLLKQVTHYRGLLWFRSMVDDVCFCMRTSDAQAVVKNLHSVLRVTKPKNDGHEFGPFQVQVTSAARITIPLALPDLVEQRVPVDRDWLIAIKPLLDRTFEILSLRGGSRDFTIEYDGDQAVEGEVDRKSIPPHKE
ncbi:hypothetical protein K8R04_04215 [Candidatus Uhrbacteria bacterium]|nr:hypothetical protein [Candidatus Uhrbacteria bacterium]